MEHLWSQAGATGGYVPVADMRASKTGSNRQIRCHRLDPLPIGAHGKEGVTPALARMRSPSQVTDARVGESLLCQLADREKRTAAPVTLLAESAIVLRAATLALRNRDRIGVQTRRPRAHVRPACEQRLALQKSVGAVAPMALRLDFFQDHSQTVLRYPGTT
jgi:hypothetical protein